MSNISTGIAGVRLLIGSTDYSSELVSFNVSDDSITSSTIIQTSGDIVLSQSPLGKPVNDYFGKTFPVGTLIRLDVKQPNGEYIRHPRGFLYVISSSYDAQTKEMTLRVGCGLALALEYQESTVDIAANLIAEFIPQSLIDKLPPNQKNAIGDEDGVEFDYTLLANCLQAQGKVIYQDKWGNIQLVNIFGSSGSFVTNPSAVYKFTSFDTDTILSIESQSDTSPIAQTKIEFTYQLTGRESEINETDPTDKENAFKPYETDQEFFESNICTSDFGSVLDKDDDISGDDERSTTKVQVIVQGTADPGYIIKDVSESRFDQENPYKDYGAINQTYTDVQTTISEKYYAGPGKQVNKETEETTQNGLSIVGSIAKDYVQVLLDFGSPNPNSTERFTVSEAVNRSASFFARITTASKTETYNEYGRGGELIRKTVYSYEPLGNLSGDSYAFAYDLAFNNGPNPFDMVLAQKTITTYQVFEFESTETTRTWEYTYRPFATAFRIDKRTSGNNNRNPLQEDSLANTSVDSISETFSLDPVTFEPIINPFDEDATQLCAPKDQVELDFEYEAIEGVQDQVSLESGLSVLLQRGAKIVPGLITPNVPVMLINQNIENYPLEYRPLRSKEYEKDYKNDIDEYARIVHRKAIADGLGFTIQETLRPEFYSWYPSYPYRLVFKSENKAFYMRVSAATWTLNNSEAICSFESMMIADYTFSAINAPNYTQLDYLLPPVDVPTTGNNTIGDHDSQLGTSVRRVTISPGLPSTPIATPVTSLPTITASKASSVFNLAGVITFKVRTVLRVSLISTNPVSPAPAPVAITFNGLASMSVNFLAFNFGTITSPSPQTFNFGTIRNPTTASVEFGTITNPTF